MTEIKFIIFKVALLSAAAAAASQNGGTSQERDRPLPPGFGPHHGGEMNAARIIGDVMSRRFSPNQDNIHKEED